MGLSDAVIRRSYDSGNRSVNVVRDFLEPILSESITYDRLTGFFTSGMLAAAARGIGSFLSAGGKMRMVTSPQLSPRDIQAIDEIEELESRNAVFDACILRGLQGLSQLQSSIERDHVAAMAWMIKTGALEIRIAVPAPGRHDLNALFHHKVGIVRSSEGEQLSFSGSINETAAAWTSNFESFKVFREWVDAEREYFNDDVELFDTYWNADEDSLTRVIPLSEAVREQLLSIAPETLDEVLVKLQSSGSNKQNSESSQPIKFRDYQVAAIKAWKDAGYRGILAMATGTGKTKTAVGCFQELAKSEEKLVVVVTSPFQHISVQWAKEFAPWDALLLAGVTGWRKKLTQQIQECELGAKSLLVISVVQDTASSSEFVSKIESLKSHGFKALLIGDEAHGLGARSRQRALSADYDFRLGLSATPERYFDEIGTAVLEDYFGGDVFSFPIDLALKWRDPVDGSRALCDYDYVPILIKLNPDEIDVYVDLTKQLVEAMQRNETDSSVESEDRVKRILLERSMVLKSAQAKIPALDKLLKELNDIDHALVYCVDSKQMDEVMETLDQNGVIYRRFTGAEGTAQKNEMGGLSEREMILSSLDRGDVDALVAIRCLDEGVDVPSAHTAIILASSGNPREFVQRRGRILRPNGPSKIARIFDFVIEPCIPQMRDATTKEFELKVFEAEVARMSEFARCARNGLEAQEKVLSIKRVGLRG